MFFPSSILITSAKCFFQRLWWCSTWRLWVKLKMRYVLIFFEQPQGLTFRSCYSKLLEFWKLLKLYSKFFHLLWYSKGKFYHVISSVLQNFTALLPHDNRALVSIWSQTIADPKSQIADDRKENCFHMITDDRKRSQSRLLPTFRTAKVSKLHASSASEKIAANKMEDIF